MSRKSTLKAAILIISDTAYSDPSTDRAGDALRDTFAEDGGGQWDVQRPIIVPDKISAIQRYIHQWCDDSQDEFVNLIVTTGGTGFAQKDHTPEAVEPLIERHASGLV